MSNTRFSNLTAIVTGGAQGIGFAVVERLIAEGARVASWDVLEKDNETSMGAFGEKAHAVTCDITDENSVNAALKSTEKKFGNVSILVNSAGITGPTVTVDEYDFEQWRRVVDINLNGTFLVNKAVVPSMKENNFGRILNIASIAGKEGNPNASAYSASKAGVIGLTKSLGKELASFDIAVNALTPAAAKTKIFDQMSQKHIDYMLSKIPRNRFLLVEEAAAMILWLVSKENSFTTGFAFDISGGRATY